MNEVVRTIKAILSYRAEEERARLVGLGAGGAMEA